MADPKEGILPLVGRVIKQRLGEVKEEASREFGEGLGDLRHELEEELGEGEAAPVPTRIAVDSK